MTSLMPTVDILDRLSSGFIKVTRRVDILASNGAAFFDDIGIIDGTISVDAARDERRTCDVTLVDHLGRLEASPDALWYDKLVRVWRGITWPGGSWEAPLGTFMPDRIGDVTRIKKRSRPRPDQPYVETDPETPFSLAVQVTGRDLTKKLLTSKLTVPITFVAGTSIETIIRAEAALAGITTLTLPWVAGVVPAPVLEIDQTFEAGATRYSLIDTLCKNYGYEAYIAATTELVVRAFRDPATMPAIWSFQTGLEGNLASYEKSVNDSELYNHVVVRGAGQANAFVFAEVEITDTASPIHRDRIGDRTFPFDSPTVSTNAEALALATILLKVHALQSYDVQLGSVVLPWLEAGEVVRFIDPQAPTITGDPERFFLSDFTIPMAIGETMDGTAKRVVPVAA